ncbi:hypothetical protein CHS0354_027874 [Potamilus streckersoni]|uniref:Uncharacterized protein n=1 Tax=Potamilus streckersoni TaxID=2493646 RepID=A0AAE0T414_9BIVA|nr:hypothetical protein CHS0354_027874 [Potamilus streckersoni]
MKKRYKYYCMNIFVIQVSYYIYLMILQAGFLLICLILQQVFHYICLILLYHVAVREVALMLKSNHYNHGNQELNLAMRMNNHLFSINVIIIIIISCQHYQKWRHCFFSNNGISKVTIVC